MSQFLSQLPRQMLRQEQRLTPQLIQAMDILQLNAQALEARIEQELDANPALELARDDEGHTAPETVEPAEKALSEQPLDVAEGDAQDFARLDDFNTEYDLFEDDAEYRGTKSAARRMEEGDSKLEAMANTAARPQSLRDYLIEQWHLLTLDERTRKLGEALIEDLDDAGRVTTPLAELGARLNPAATAEALEEVLKRVQELEPRGVGARNVQECLLLQLEALPGDNALEVAIIRDHFEDLQRNRLPAIAKALNVEVEDVKAALGVLARLSLHPGRDVVDRPAPPIQPDVLVEYDEATGEYDVRLARANQRELRISAEFRAALEEARRDKTVRDFLRQKIEAANAIIDAVQYRRNRLVEVARAVVEAQRDFLERGEQFIRVLRMSELAERFGCDPSTISRTVDDKYMQTPQGIFPIRRFFTGGAATDDGEVLGWESIRAKVQEIIANEDKAAPLSDDQIVEMLRGQGIDIKRRTIAKYRSQLAIPTARQRRQY
jgi:RNA polymerase sigma-54 factor